MNHRKIESTKAAIGEDGVFGVGNLYISFRMTDISVLGRVPLFQKQVLVVGRELHGKMS